MVQHLAFNAAAFRQLGGRYVLSAVRLAHPEASGLRLLGVFDDSEAYWRLHLYEAAGQSPLSCGRLVGGRFLGAGAGR
jgi:hypothetical protein